MNGNRASTPAAFALTLLSLASPGTATGEPPPTREETEKAVAAIRAEHAAVDAAIGKSSLRTARVRIGGGQNPGEVTVHYRGGTEGDFEKDPYAAPFVPRRIVVHRVLPAVGDAWARFTYDGNGVLLFAFTTGPDVSGVPSLDLRPADELRAYFLDGEPIRVIHPRPEGGPPRTVDLGVEQDAAARETARRAAAALLERGRALAEAFTVLAR